jgi:hypothetical protein
MKATLLSKNSALARISVFMTGATHYVLEKHPVLVLIENTDPLVRSEVANLTVRSCLEKFLSDKQKSRYFITTNSLSLALKISETESLSIDVKEKLIETLAFAGYIGYFPRLPQKFLGRNMKESEVSMLVDAYVSNTSSRDSQIEKKLFGWIRIYLPTEKQQKEIDKLNTFINKWNSEIDI